MKAAQSEWLRFTRFFTVGAIAFAMQMALLIGLVEWVRFDPVSASAVGFALAAVANYWLNRTLTFNSSNPHKLALSRFIVMASIGLILNSFLMALAVWLNWVSYALAQIFCSGVILVWNYWLSSRWVFKPHHPVVR